MVVYIFISKYDTILYLRLFLQEIGWMLMHTLQEQIRFTRTCLHGLLSVHGILSIGTCHKHAVMIGTGPVA